MRKPLTLSERQKIAKTRLALSVELVNKHYAACDACGRDDEPCAKARGHWDLTARSFVDVVRTCAEWHHAKFQGAERGRVLTRKLRKVAALLTRPPRG